MVGIDKALLTLSLRFRKADAIVTRNGRDFKTTSLSLPIYTPKELLMILTPPQTEDES